ncbi:mitotic checkpoint serine/threonine-protein kinase BUB1 beta [Nelusetta ayraudi]|uniref:mitotic checkpoint serine/threonine-protein kinase BUB1 beta n=1 Tax=Nelusetta ayraudi TaxID=303726 RepID=UPI003F7142F3
MAEGGEVDWELSKENIQPLRRGRNMSSLNRALSQLHEGDSTAVNQQRQAFESELRMYEGDDPLDVWHRYIGWTEQTFPHGGKESNLSTLLECVVKKFTDEKKYHNDPRYVDLWIKFAGNCPEPLEIYNYMQARGIGVTQASFYIAWSEEYENLGNFRKADLIFQEGLQNWAEPHDKLQQYHRALQARVTRQTLLKAEEDDSDEEPKEPERISLAQLKQRGKKGIIPIVRTGNAIKSSSGGLQLRGATAGASTSNSRLVIFDENKAENVGTSESKLEPWLPPPTSKAKENEKKAERWCDVKMPQKSKFGHTITTPRLPKPAFQPFVEESDLPPTMTPCKINPAVTTVLSTRKPCKEETPLKRLQDHHQQQQEAESGKAQEQSMYCKELLLLSGATEFSFEELRAERHFKKVALEAGGQKDKSGAATSN